MQDSAHKFSFKHTQTQFTNYIRDPKHHSLPQGIQPERMQMYRELMFNNIESFLANNFPVLKHILPTKQWQTLSYDFFAQHHCCSPYFTEIPEEFIHYLQSAPTPLKDEYPFLLELVHYEWVEMALSIAQTPSPSKHPQVINQLSQKIQLSPLAWLLAYQYPVHRICPDFLPRIAPEQPSYLTIYRDQEDKVHFLELAPMSFSLLQGLQDQEAIEIKHYLQTILPIDADESLHANALTALQQFIDKYIILLHS